MDKVATELIFHTDKQARAPLRGATDRGTARSFAPLAAQSQNLVITDCAPHHRFGGFRNRMGHRRRCVPHLRLGQTLGRQEAPRRVSRHRCRICWHSSLSRASEEQIRLADPCPRVSAGKVERCGRSGVGLGVGLRPISSDLPSIDVLEVQSGSFKLSQVSLCCPTQDANSQQLFRIGTGIASRMAQSKSSESPEDAARETAWPCISRLSACSPASAKPPPLSSSFYSSSPSVYFSFALGTHRQSSKGSVVAAVSFSEMNEPI
jgi:hypothetical protein